MVAAEVTVEHAESSACLGYAATSADAAHARLSVSALLLNLPAYWEAGELVFYDAVLV